MMMSNSPLISGTILTNNCTSPRRYKITKITPHFMEWYTSARKCCESFIPAARMASANYCIGKDGEIFLNVDERNRAWTSGNYDNDHRAITIECANYMDSGRYGVLPDVVWNSLVMLCIDICKRNEISKLVFTGNSEGNLTMHKYFQDTNCPGPWLSNQFDRLAKEVNAQLIDSAVPHIPDDTKQGMYVVNVQTLNVRDQPSLDGAVVAEYHYNDVVMLDGWFIQNDGYSWGRYTATLSGKHRYVALGRDTGKVEPDDYLIPVER